MITLLLALILAALIVSFLVVALRRHVPPVIIRGPRTRLYMWRVHVKGMPRGFKVREVPWNV